MALKVKAVERLLKFDKNDPGSYRYVLTPELYTSLDQKKVIREAALRSGVSQGVFVFFRRNGACLFCALLNSMSDTNEILY